MSNKRKSIELSNQPTKRANNQKSYIQIKPLIPVKLEKSSLQSHYHPSQQINNHNYLNRSNKQPPILLPCYQQLEQLKQQGQLEQPKQLEQQSQQEQPKQLEQQEQPKQQAQPVQLEQFDFISSITNKEDIIKFSESILYIKFYLIHLKKFINTINTKSSITDKQVFIDLYPKLLQILNPLFNKLRPSIKKYNMPHIINIKRFSSQIYNNINKLFSDDYLAICSGWSLIPECYSSNDLDEYLNSSDYIPEISIENKNQQIILNLDISNETKYIQNIPFDFIYELTDYIMNIIKKKNILIYTPVSIQNDIIYKIDEFLINIRNSYKKSNENHIQMLKQQIDRNQNMNNISNEFNNLFDKQYNKLTDEEFQEEIIKTIQELDDKST